MENLYKKVFFGTLFLLCIVTLSQTRGVNGGMNCAVCTIVSGIIQQGAFLKGLSIINAAKQFCKRLPLSIQNPCFRTVDELEPFFTDKRVLDILTPDAFCYALRSCHIDPGEEFCHLFPKPHISFRKTADILEKIANEYNIHNILRKLQFSSYEQHWKWNKQQPLLDPIFNYYAALKSDSTMFSKDCDDSNEILPCRKQLNHVDFCMMPILKNICDIFLGTFHDLKPAQDFDGDGFSIVKAARGADWKGKDCNDLDINIYPGAQTRNLDAFYDSNCNGIWGIDNVTGRPWEELLCEDTESRGFVYLGDSFGAHFHFPEAWINPLIPNKSSIIAKLDAILDELDWPEIGFATGYRNTTHPDLIKGPTDSVYLHLRSHNLCNHRDYQNIARNGASSSDSVEEANGISRSPSDKPVVLVYAMVGNDVCNRFHETVGNMTSPDKFKAYVLDSLKILNKKLPRKSHVVLLSLLDASFIYPTMSERIHPLGSVFNNIQYKDMYSWFSCMQIGPCEGWMTENATLRKITTQKSIELSQVLYTIASESNFESFKVHYLKNPLNMVIEKWVSDGGKIYELVDRVDSTHANQKAQPLMAVALWESLKDLGIFGPENPNNQKILQLFHDQGGH